MGYTYYLQASSKLDSETSRNWKEFISTLKSPTLRHDVRRSTFSNDFFGFLRQGAAVLEPVQASKTVTKVNAE